MDQSDFEPHLPATVPELRVWMGEGTSARLVVVLGATRSSRMLGTHCERLAGPWVDPDEAEDQLEELRQAKVAGDLLELDWLCVSSGDVVAGFIDQRSAGER